MEGLLDTLLFFVCTLLFLLSFVLLLFYSERKLAAFMQDRTGPLHNGRHGTLQPFADLLKLLRKETIVPDGARKFLFVLAPFMVFAPVLAGFSFLPLWPGWFSLNSENAGLLMLPAVISIEAIGILLAGWSSQSRFPVLGAARAIAQLVAYEVPIGLVILCVLWLGGTADFTEIQEWQSATATGGLFPELREAGGFFAWNVVQYPLLILLMPIFFLSMLAESNRAPFDIPEGESEIIGGFHTEYSGFLWAVFFLAEYAMMLLLSLVFCYLFLGGAHSPFPLVAQLPFLSQPAFFWLASKSLLLGLLMIWIRWTLPRLRADQLSALAWRILSPAALIIFLLLVIFM